MAGHPASQLNDRRKWNIDAGGLVDLAIDPMGLDFPKSAALRAALYR